jgi:hypothetical protein
MITIGENSHVIEAISFHQAKYPLVNFVRKMANNRGSISLFNFVTDEMHFTMQNNCPLQIYLASN